MKNTQIIRHTISKHDPKGISYAVTLPKEFGVLYEIVGHKWIAIHIEHAIASAVADIPYLKSRVPTQLYLDSREVKCLVLRDYEDIFAVLVNSKLGKNQDEDSEQ